jgi:hypothetical protein
MTRKAPAGNAYELAWFKSSYSDGNEGDSCVELATTPGTIHVRDSKNTDGPSSPSRRRHGPASCRTPPPRADRPGYSTSAHRERAMTAGQAMHYPNHTMQTRALHAYLHWRNANARHHGVLAAERRERVRIRIRSEKGIRWGGRPVLAA